MANRRCTPQARVETRLRYGTGVTRATSRLVCVGEESSQSVISARPDGSALAAERRSCSTPGSYPVDCSSASFRIARRIQRPHVRADVDSASPIGQSVSRARLALCGLVALAVMSKETRAVLNLRDPEAVVRTLDDALRSFERGGAVPVGVRELLLELSATLAESSSYEAGLSGPKLALARKRAARGIAGLGDDRPAVQCREAKRALGGLRQIYETRAAAGKPVEPFWLRRRERPVEEQVQRLLAKVKVDQRLGEGSRTLFRARVVIVRGVHLADFELLDQSGRRMGSAIPLDEETASGRWRRCYDFRDQDDHSLFVLRDTSPKRRDGFLPNWTYEVSDPEGGGVVNVCHERRRCVLDRSGFRADRNDAAREEEVSVAARRRGWAASSACSTRLQEGARRASAY